jgi:hypothetical protein
VYIHIGVDAMVSIIAHELSETITDSYSAWYDASGYENAGKL